MITKIKKRDGREVAFNMEKITNAMIKATKSINEYDYDIAFDLAKKVANLLEEDEINIPTVEEIQDIVEKVLIENEYAKTAKAYILYRAERTRVREMNTRLMKVYEDLTFKQAEDNDIKRENANIDGNTAMGTMLKYGSEGAKEFNEMFVLNPKHSRAHKDGDIHIHDLDFLTLTTTCCQIDIIKLFKDGFSTGHGYLREPKDIQSYSALACIAIQSNQNDQHGGQSIPNFDYGLAIGVRKTYVKLYRKNIVNALELLTEKEDILDFTENIFQEIKEDYDLMPSLENDEKYIKIEKEYLCKYIDDNSIVEKVQEFAKRKANSETDRCTYQAMEAFIHNLNTMHSRAGAQVPFSSVNYGTDTSAEGRMVVKNLLLATERGLGNGETPIFPIQIFKVKEGVNYNEGDSNYDLFKLSFRVSAKRLFPNYSFIDAPFNLKYYKEGNPNTEIAYMGCRTRVMSNINDKSKEVVYGRGNLSFTTINLPRIALKSNKDIEKFFEELDKEMDIVIDQLKERFEIQSKKKVKNFPFLMGQGVWIDSDKLSWEDEVGEVLKHGTLSAGFIGLGECLKALTGSHHGESKDAQKLGLEIISYMRNAMDLATEKYKLNFSIIGTPAEGTAGRFVKLDREIYGSIEGVTDREYYTNSFHVPVYYEIGAFNKIKIEAPYHELTNGGHITYVELDGDPSQNLQAFEKVIRTMKECGVGYGSINHPLDRDPVCGYSGIIGEQCPGCGRKEEDVKFQRIRRITGYLVGTLDRFNDAKKAEERDRVKHL
ncbi:anaerobic ribonucleoside triphosphate reductase [Clostridium algidicarnis]|uniref:Anaerobic ribonucleoside triphosphate reductase n=1 Tax=Clostridium algidicarnis TaxID=37659 RepID=A0ABS6BZ30_9CLOT|nr:anaerobic ribonucleoside triphosphate reductase [Clostridium algidicarnis]MBU3218499.1 anaerobic ribonucleoside triphosphate reductase [Clostridium algidicarnis]